MVEKFPGRDANSIKNKFYTTLKRVATRAQLENPSKYPPTLVKDRKSLLQFVELAMEYGDQIPSKRGRKCNSDWQQAPNNSILFPSDNKPSTFINPVVNYSPLHQPSTQGQVYAIPFFYLYNSSSCNLSQLNRIQFLEVSNIIPKNFQYKFTMLWILMSKTIVYLHTSISMFQ